MTVQLSAGVQTATTKRRGSETSTANAFGLMNCPFLNAKPKLIRSLQPALPLSQPLAMTNHPRAFLEEGLDRAAREASEVIPPTLNLERHRFLKKILEDRILLEMFHIHGIQPALYGDLVAEARREGWG